MAARTAPIVVLLLAVSVAAAFSQQTKPFTADRHGSRGLECASCHGGGEKKPVSGAQCLTCHESIEEVAKKTADIEPNPHDNHETVGGLDCTECHKGHKQDVVLCRQCHTAMKFERKGNELHR
ncbi:MAG: cytochrome c3 family protein [Terracidiphilus sp.]|jgi:fumarate reductase flavoprotein subunit